MKTYPSIRSLVMALVVLITALTSHAQAIHGPFHQMAGTTGAAAAAAPAIGIAKRVSAGPTIQADGSYNVTYTFVVKNYGDQALSNVQIDDDLSTVFLSPASYTVTNITGGNLLKTVPRASYTGQTGGTALLYPGPSSLGLGASDSVKLTLNVQLNNTYSTFNNSATASATTPDNTGISDASTNGADPDPNNNNDATDDNSPTPLVVSRPDVNVTMTASKSTVIVGDVITFTITATNTGGDAVSTNISDLLPSGYTFISATPGTGAYNSGTGIWTIGIFPAANSATLALQASVNASGTYTNTATATTTGDIVPANDAASITPTVTTAVDIQTSKTLNSAYSTAPFAGTNVQFDINVTNAGSANSSSVTLRDTLAAGFNYISGPAGTAYDPSDRIVTRTFALNAGQTITTSIIVSVVPNLTADNYSNSATATPVETDSNPANNSSGFITLTPVPAIDLQVSKSFAAASPLHPGDAVTFTIIAKNNGPSDATNVIVGDTLQSGYAFVNANATTGAYDIISGLWNIGSLPANTTQTLTIQTTLLPDAGYGNTAYIKGTEQENNTNDNVYTLNPAPTVTQSSDLAITQATSATGNAADAGSTITFTVNVHNNGPSKATGVKVTDLLPSGFTFVSSTAGAGYDPATGIWTAGNIAAGADASMTLTVKVSPLSGSIYKNTSTITSADQYDAVSNNNSTSVTITVTPVSSISVTKTADNSTPDVGSDVTFTITATNLGPSDATNVKVTDAWPSGYTFVSATPSAAYTTAGGAWSIGNMPAGTSQTLVLKGHVLTTGIYQNTATISAAEQDSTAADNSAAVTPVPVPVANLSVTKTADAATRDVGSNITFTITAKNSGPNAATNVHVKDLLPNGYTFVSASAPAGTNYNVLTGDWNIGSLAANASTVLTVIASVEPTGVYTNTAVIKSDVKDNNTTDDTARVTPTIRQLTDLYVQKTKDSTTLYVNSTMKFHIKVGNAGPNDATNVVVTDLLPTGYTFISADQPGYDPASGVWNIGNLASGATLDMAILVKANVAGTNGIDYTNTVTVTGDPGQYDQNTGNNTASAAPDIKGIADLVLTKTVDKSTPVAGTNVNFTFNLRNNGPSNATGAVVLDTLSTAFIVVDPLPTGMSYNTATHILTWNVGNLALNADTAASFEAQINPSQAAVYQNTAYASSNEDDLQPGNNEGAVSVTPQRQVDLNVTKTIAAPSPLYVGDTVKFTIVASNAGPSTGTQVQVIDQLRSGYKFVTYTTSNSTVYDHTTNVWTPGDLVPGQSETLTIVATLLPDGDYQNQANIFSAETETNNADNIDQIVAPTVTALTDLEIKKTADVASADAGATVHFHLVATNHGPNTASNVSVQDLLPDGYTFVSSSSAAYNKTTGLWSIGLMPASTSQTLDITARMNAAGTSFKNIAVISGDASQLDTALANNTDSATIAMVPLTTIYVNKTVGSSTPDVGSNVTFTITAYNDGPSTATNVVVTDAWPSGYTFVSATPSVGTYDVATGLWTIGTLASGTSQTLNITGTVKSTGTYDNTASITGAEKDTHLGPATVTVSVVPTQVANISIQKTISNDKPDVNDPVTFHIALRNDGPDDASNVSVNDVLQDGYTYINSLASTGAYDAASGNWTVGNLANGATATLDIDATVNPTGTYDNSATVHADQKNNGPVTSSIATPTVRAVADIFVSKVCDSVNAHPGDVVTFTITASNNGPSMASGVIVKEVLPDGYAFIGTDQSPMVYDALTNEWNVNFLNPDPTQTITMHIQATVLPDATNYTNKATIAGAEYDPVMANDTATVTPNIIQTVDLSVSKFGDDPAPDAGGTVHFKLTAANSGPSIAHNVVVSDTLRSGFEVITPLPAGVNYNSTNRVLTWNVGTMATGTSLFVNYGVSVVADQPADAYENQAFIHADEMDINPVNDSSATIVVVPTPVADLSIDKKIIAPSPLYPGDTVRFLLIAQNDGPSRATSIVVTDALQSGYKYISSTGNGTYDNTAGTWTGFALDNGQRDTLTITTTVNATGAYGNSASIDALQVDHNPANDNVSIVTPTVTPAADMELLKTVDSINVWASHQLTFKLRAINHGLSTASTVVAKDVLPNGFTYSSSTATHGAYEPATSNWNIGTLASGDTATLLLTVNVKADATNYQNTASVTALETDLGPTNNKDTATVNVQQVVDVAIDKTVDNAGPNEGDVIHFTLKAANNGPSIAHSVVVTDVMPKGFVPNGAVSTPLTYDATTNTITWPVGTVNAGASTTATFAVKVVPDQQPADYINQASITAAETDTLTGSNTSSAVTVTPVAVADLQLAKTVSAPSPLYPGSTVTFTLTATNAGPSNAANASVTDLLHAGYQFISATGGTYNNATGAWIIGNMAKGDTRTLTITAKVLPDQADYANTATITSSTKDTLSTNNNASITTPVVTPLSDLAITKTVDSTTVYAGHNVTFTITATNNGPSNAAGVIIAEQLPAGYTLVSRNASAGTVNNSFWTLGNLDAGKSDSLKITATVLPTGTAFLNQVTISSANTDTTMANNMAAAQPIMVPVADLSVSKTVDNATPYEGDTIHFTLAIHNAGPNNATGTIVADTLLAGFTPVLPLPAGVTYNNTSHALLWTVGTLASGANNSQSFAVRVVPDQPASDYVNTASVNAGIADIDLTNNTSSPVTVTPVPAANVRVTKTITAPSPLHPGDNVTFTITAENAGPGKATNVVVTDVLQSGYQLVSATPATYAANKWTIASLAAGATQTMTITAKVLPDAVYGNTATISADQHDSGNSDNTAAITAPTVTQVADLGLTKTVDNTTEQVNHTVVFTLTATNNGPSAATGVVVKDPLPDGFTYISSIPTGSYNAGQWTINNLLSGESKQMQIVATVAPDATSYNNIASIKGNVQDNNKTNDTANAKVIPVPVAQLSITKVADNNTPDVGSTVTFTLTAKNSGPGKATNVKVTDALPAGYTLVSSNTTTGTYSAGVWTIGNMSVNQAATLTVAAKVNTTGSYTNTATISSSEKDTVLSDNTASVTPVPVPIADLSITKAINTTAPNAGDIVHFTITAKNGGPVNVTDAVVNEVLQSGYTFIQATPAAAYNATTGKWAIGSLASGATTTLIIDAKVNASGDYSNTASITSATIPDRVPGNNSASSTTPTVHPITDLQIKKTVDSASIWATHQLTFTLTATNNGPSDATGVTVTDLLPAGYTFISKSLSNYNEATGVWNIGNLLNGGVQELKLQATAKADAAAAAYKNRAAITGNETDLTPTNNADSVTPVVKQIIDVSIVKTADQLTPDEGDTIHFILHAHNDGPATAHGVVVADQVSNGFSIVPPLPTGMTYDGPSRTIAWLPGTMNAGADASATFAVRVVPNQAAALYVNSANIDAAETDIALANNTSTLVTITPRAVSNLHLTKSITAPSPLYPGAPVTFTLSAKNEGPSNATGVTVTDILQSGYTLVSATPATGTYNAATGKWTIGALTSGQATSMTISAIVNPDGVYSNTATTSVTQADKDNSDNTASITTPVVTQLTNLSITKTADRTDADVNDLVLFTLTAKNNGPSKATNVTVTDLLPTGYTFMSASDAGYNNTTGKWTIATLASGATAQLQISTRVNAGGNYTNTATIAGTELDTVSTDNSASVTVTAHPVASVRVTKTVDNATPDVNTSVTFTITAKNDGPSNATNVKVSDALPTGYTQTSATASTGTFTGGVWTIGSLANGASAILTVKAKVNVTGNYINTATVSAAEKDPDATDNTASAATTPVPVADLQLAKTISNTTPDVGSNVTFTLTARNNGASAANNVVVNDVLKNGYTFVSANPAASYDDAAGNWVIGALAANASATLTITAKVNPTGAYDNTAWISGLEKDNDKTNDTAKVAAPTVRALTDLSITKTVDSTTVDPGHNLHFTLTAHNAGPSDATGVTVTDLLPTGYTFVSASNAGYDKTTGTWTIGALASGSDAVLTITATVKTSGVYTNTASITGTQTDTVAANNTASATPTVRALADVRLTKTVDKATPDMGSKVTFTITATNNGPANATGVTVTDALPGGYTLGKATPGAGTFAAGVWNLGTLASGTTATLTVEATVNATGNYTNVATISAAEMDLVPANNSASAATTPTPVADVAITKTISNSNPQVGDVVTFTLTAGNNGPVDATGVIVSDKLQTGYTFVDATPAGVYDATTGVWNIGTLANSSTSSLLIKATVNANGNYANSATITATEKDANVTNNTAAITPPAVQALADLDIMKTADSTNAEPGHTVHFSLTAHNAGPSNATSVTVTDILPTGYTFVSASDAGYDKTTGTWNIPTLNNGDNKTLTITATMNAAGNYANTATIKGAEKDSNPANNSSTATVTLTPVADLAVTKAISNKTPNVTSSVTFTITAANHGPSNATNVKVTEVVPSGYTVTGSNTATGTYDGSTWTIGTLANNATATLTITATVNVSGNYTNTVSISAAEKDTALANNTASVTATPNALADVSVTKTISKTNPEVGEVITFTLTAKNAGPSTATGVIVTDLLKSGYTFVSAGSTGYDKTTGIWSLGNMTNGNVQTLTISASVNAGGNYANTAVITAGETDPLTSNNTASITPPTPKPLADVEIVKTVDQDKPGITDNVVFKLAVTNHGPSDATSVKVVDILPAGYTFVSADDAGYDKTTGVWYIATLANGSTQTLGITATVNASGSYSNTATVSATETDKVLANNTSTVATMPYPVTDLEVTKTGDNDFPMMGSTMTFTITAKNNGPSDATNVQVTDVLKSGYAFQHYTATRGTFDPATGIWALGSLGNGHSETMTMTVIVAQATGTTNFANTATISGAEADRDQANNSSTVTPTPVRLLAIDDQLTTENPDSVSADLTANDTYGPNGHFVVIKDQPLHGTVVINTDNTVTYTPVPGYTGNDSFTYTIEDKSGNSSNTATVAIAVKPRQIDLDIKKVITTAPGDIKTGKLLTFRITVMNKSAKPTGNVLMEDVLQSNIGDAQVLLQADSGQASFDAMTRTVTWTLDTLAGGSSVQLTISGKLQSGGAISNTATVKGRDEDPDDTNNSSTVTASSVADDLAIPNVFTPNGDGVNDRFVILGLERYTNVKLVVWNRWGNVVYQSTDYHNTWDGSSLNEGTYFYQVDANGPDGKQQFKGWLQLMR
ncbi:hypothetical protein DCC81_17645 [Chitinophaga parva]|uniref:DUF11 domain-containing protein n=1 Tax=Chitinophaga parva TaxID=2169414 RepID=A0A2T7BIF5_9BACT|nr:gliding motility-associated C-terminal domain-containing protein [Chitinophaga parva]PUZ26065.1 hypothetical protein DCC81_17645 [Chitinophaga parva]